MIGFSGRPRFRLAVPLLYAAIAAGWTAASLAQAPEPDAAALRGGRNYIPTRVYTEAEDRRILTPFDGLRVADVSDGMDAVGLQNIGLMDPEIRPLWKDTKEFTHRFIGV